MYTIHCGLKPLSYSCVIIHQGPEERLISNEKIADEVQFGSICGVYHFYDTNRFFITPLNS